MTLKNRKYQLSFKKTGSKKKRTYNLTHRKLTKKTITGGRRWPWSKKQKNPELGPELTEHEIQKGNNMGLFGIKANPVFATAASVALPSVNQPRVPLSVNPMYASGKTNNVPRSPNPFYESENTKTMPSEPNYSALSVPRNNSGMIKPTYESVNNERFSNPLYGVGAVRGSLYIKTGNYNSVTANRNYNTTTSPNTNAKYEEIPNSPYESMEGPKYEEIQNLPSMKGPKQKPKKGKFTRTSGLTPVEKAALETANNNFTIEAIPKSKYINNNNLFKLNPKTLEKIRNNSTKTTGERSAAVTLLNKYLAKISRDLAQTNKTITSVSQQKSTGNSSVNNPTYESRTINSSVTTANKPYYGTPRNIEVRVNNPLPGPPVHLKNQELQIPGVVSSVNNA
jgi:hypothetical protein